MKKINFDEWVSNNNPSEKLSYGKGWWDYIEYIRKLGEMLDTKDINVIDTFEMETPPPSEILSMPVFEIKFTGFKVYLKEHFSFSGFHDAWVVSVVMKKKQSCELNLSSLGLINNLNKKEKVYPEFMNGFTDKIIFEDYSPELNMFSGSVNDSWDLYALLKVIRNSI